VLFPLRRRVFRHGADARAEGLVASLSLDAMREYLKRSISSLNANKLRGLLAEVEFRAYLINLGFANRVSPGGWIVRSTGTGTFAQQTVVLFPELLVPNTAYPATNPTAVPTPGLHSICAVFQQSGINSYFCATTIDQDDKPSSLA
jgi:hypothetical protein